MGIENLAEDLLNEEPEEQKEKESKAPGSIEDDIYDGIGWLYSEIKRLEQSVADSKRAKLENLAEFQEELSAAKRELYKEWGGLSKLFVERRTPTLAESAMLKEERLVALNKVAEAAKGAGVRLEDIEAVLHETTTALRESGLRRGGEARHEFQTREIALREKHRLLTEARFWLKKEAIIKSLLEEKRSAVGETMRKREPLEQFFADMKYLEMIAPENDLEWRVLSDLMWQEGAEHGKPRGGHPEGKNIFHIVEVLHNIEKLQHISEHEREQLRLVALIHDSFKQQVDRSKPRVGENHHGMLARRFAEKYTQDEVMLKIIQLHDEAFNAWRRGHESGDWERAEKRLRSLIINLGKENLQLYLLFYQCDNETGTKDQECVRWFKERIKEL